MNFYQSIITHKRSGFTLVEFVIIISIFGIMAGIVSFNFSGFRNSAGLNNVTHDIALSIYGIQKKALSGISPETAGIVTGSQISDALPYGIAFKKSSSGNGFDPTFILFRDNDSDFEFTSISATDLIIDTVQIQTTDSISAIETYDGSTYTPVPTVAGDYFSITFKRPWPEVRNLSSNIEHIRITMTSGDNTHKSIIISSIGKISIE